MHKRVVLQAPVKLDAGKSYVLCEFHDSLHVGQCEKLATLPFPL